jgi:hypothetical protein
MCRCRAIRGALTSALSLALATRVSRSLRPASASSTICWCASPILWSSNQDLKIDFSNTKKKKKKKKKILIFPKKKKRVIITCQIRKKNDSFSNKKKRENKIKRMIIIFQKKEKEKKKKRKNNIQLTSHITSIFF